MTESGLPQVGFNPDVWVGFFGPAGMAIPVVIKLNTEINESLKSPEVDAVLRKLALEPKVTTPQEFATFVAAEMQKLPPIVRAAGLKPELP